MAEIIRTLFFGDGIESLSDSGADHIEASGCGASRESLDLGKKHLDGVQVRGIGREEAQFGFSCLDGRASFGVLVDVEVVADDDIALAQGGRECPLDPDDEGIAVHRAGDQHGCNDPVVPQSGDEGVVLPVAMRHGADARLSLFGSPAQPRHLGIESALVDE